MSMSSLRGLLPAVALLLLLPAPARAEVVTLKIATLAPEGSAWMKLFGDWKGAIDKRTAGQVKVKFYAGGVAGDERDVVRKMRLGQMSGAAVTAVGLGLIQPDVRVLEIPFLFNDEAELDLVRGALDQEFRKKFQDKGYQLLAWGDVGPVRLLTNTALRDKGDLQKVKMWVWSDDPLAARLYQRLGINAVPLGVPDVLPSLQTGLINACGGSPLAAVALQWHSKVKYATSMVLNYAVGALVLATKAWDGLAADQRQVVTEESKTLSDGLTRLVRNDNTAALKKMQAQGVEVVPTPEPLSATFRAEGKGATDDMEGKLFGKEFRARVDQILAGHRKR
jgi:TRAP-type C4-dicarboxylate transport system substrate-binding protein